MGFLRTRVADARGQTLAEFAIVIPLFLIVVLASLDVGRVIFANDVLTSAAREGARYASVHGATPPGCNNTTQRPCVTTPATKAGIKSYTLNLLRGGGSSAAVTVCYSAVNIQSSSEGCTGDTDEPAAQNSRGALVTVRATAVVQLVAGALLGLGNFNISSASTVLINN